MKFVHHSSARKLQRDEQAAVAVRRLFKRSQRTYQNSSKKVSAFFSGRNPVIHIRDVAIVARINRQCKVTCIEIWGSLIRSLLAFRFYRADGKSICVHHIRSSCSPSTFSAPGKRRSNANRAVWRLIYENCRGLLHRAKREDRRKNKTRGRGGRAILTTAHCLGFNSGMEKWDLHGSFPFRFPRFLASSSSPPRIADDFRIPRAVIAAYRTRFQPALDFIPFLSTYSPASPASGFYIRWLVYAEEYLPFSNNTPRLLCLPPCRSLLRGHADPNTRSNAPLKIHSVVCPIPRRPSTIPTSTFRRFLYLSSLGGKRYLYTTSLFLCRRSLLDKYFYSLLKPGKTRLRHFAPPSCGYLSNAPFSSTMYVRICAYL